MPKKVLLIDHYDSFTYNLVQQLQALGVEVTVYEHDQIALQDIDFQCFTHIILSPGPGHVKNDQDFQISKALIQKTMNRELTLPLLGVCLGHQGIAYMLGLKLIHAPKVMHGKVSKLQHCGAGLFTGLAQDQEVMRYHSWVVDPIDFQEAEPFPLQKSFHGLKVTAVSMDDQCIMAFEHHHYPIYGIQFHPESIATPSGDQMMQNFLNINRTYHQTSR
jgi:anthranilate synthase component 2